MKVLLLGGSGQVGAALQRAASVRDVTIAAPDRATCDLTDVESVRTALDVHAPAAVINAAAWTDVDGAEENVEAARAANAEGPGQLASLCAERGTPLLHYSTDYVFDGRKGSPYTEADTPNPINVYGETKLQGERRVRDAHPHHLLLRVASVFGPDGSNFVRTMLGLLASRERVSVVSDHQSSPTPADAIARTSLDLIARCLEPSFDAWGTYHYGGTPPVNWFEFAEAIRTEAMQVGAELEVDAIEPVPATAFPRPAERPPAPLLDSGKLEQALQIPAPSWQEGLRRAIARLTQQAGGAG